MDLSIVVPLYGFGREEHLALMLDSLARQERGGNNYELIIVEQRDGNREHSLEGVRHLVLPGDQRGFNKSWCLNFAARQASYEHLVFIDLDMVLEDNYLRKIASYWKDHPVGFFICWDYMIFLPGRDEPKDRLVLARLIDTAGGVWAAKKDFFWAIGGMNESYFGYGGEDNDIWYRANTALAPAGPAARNVQHMPCVLRHRYHHHCSGSPFSQKLALVSRRHAGWVRDKLLRENLGNPRQPSPIDMEMHSAPELSILIPAYRARKFLSACLSSILDQDESNVEVLIGIDACQDTREALATAPNAACLGLCGVRVFWSGENVGPYVMKNSLFERSSSRNILFFDADDVMAPYMLRALIEAMKSQRRIYIPYVPFTGSTPGCAPRVLSGNLGADGVMCIRREDFEKAVGFAPWRCAADSEFRHRAAILEIPEFVPQDGADARTEIFFYYRQGNPESLCNSAATGEESALRASYLSEIHKMRASRMINLPQSRATTPLEEIM